MKKATDIKWSFSGGGFMKKVLFFALLCGVSLADYPKPQFAVNAYHFNRLRQTVAFDIVLPSEVTLTEDDIEWFYYVINHTTMPTGLQWTFMADSDQWCTDKDIYGQTIQLFGKDADLDCGSMLPLPFDFRLGKIAQLAVNPTQYNQTITYSLYLVLPDINYFEMLSELTIDTTYQYTGEVCGDGNHPYPIGDINKDCVVDLLDFMIIAQNWLACSFDCGI